MPKRAPHVLVVEPDPLALHELESTLGRRDYIVSGVTSAPHALSWLMRAPIDVLIASTQITSTRGVQLVISERSKHPELAAVLIGTERESALEMDARRHGFAFVARPFDPDQLLMIVAEQLAGIRKRQRWPRKRLEWPIPARVGGHDARLTNISYGGVGFEWASDNATLPSTLQIEIERAQLCLDGELVWSARGPNGMTSVGGVELVNAAHPPAEWRRFVDQAC
jgi:DNA-binding response OmpR family regulator